MWCCHLPYDVDFQVRIPSVTNFSRKSDARKPAKSGRNVSLIVCDVKIHNFNALFE